MMFKCFEHYNVTEGLELFQMLKTSFHKNE